MTDYVVPQFITDYLLGGIYHPDDTAEDGNNIALSAAQPTIAIGDEYNWAWRLPADFGAFAALGIIGFKVVGQFTGSGDIGWSWEIDNPSHAWTSGDGSFIAWDNAYSGGAIHVSGPTNYEHTFALTDTAADPTYEGNSYNDPLSDLDYSLRATEDTAGFDHTIGGIQLAVDTAPESSVQILRWDLILFTEVETGSGAAPYTRLFPRDRGGIGGANRIYPRPRGRRIVGGQP